ncbi:MAG TPA: hypothetical protein VHA12_04245 [Candidatus Nanoarchaeia archaeon]|nr:hypothetical protein [Candidatus Nanoarchaeia archaeon]
MRKGQEEIVGFVAIIVIMALVVVFFLGISLRNQDQSLGESKALSQFIESTKKFTSDCDLGLKERYANLEDLVVECYRNNDGQCVNGKKVCEVYNETMTKIIESNWKIGEERPIKGYIWNVSYDKTIKNENVVLLSNGSCNGQYKEEESLSPDSLSGGTFVSRFRTCF